VFAAGWSSAIALELAVAFQFVSFQISIDALAAGACGAAPGGGFDHHQRSLLLLRNLRRREPGLL